MLITTILVLSFIQNITFTLVSRARNRDNYTYHAICACLSNLAWFATMHYLVVSDLNAALAIPYVLGTVSGSLVGQRASIKIESLIGAKS